MIKDKALAGKISEMLLELYSRLDESVMCVQMEASEEEFSEYRRGVGKVMGEIQLELLRHLYKEHPDLEPEEFK